MVQVVVSTFENRRIGILLVAFINSVDCNGQVNSSVSPLPALWCDESQLVDAAEGIQLASFSDQSVEPSANADEFVDVPTAKETNSFDRNFDQHFKVE